MTWCKRLCVVAFGMVACVSVWADETQTCTTVTPEEIASLFDRWNASLASGDPDKVVANYAPDAILLPTVSNKPRTNHEEIRDYFVHFLQKQPHGNIDKRNIKIGCNSAIDAGLYTFDIVDHEGHPAQVAARYTYTYEFRDGEWLISSHHSSAMPEKAVASTH